MDCNTDETDDVEVADAAEDDEGERARLVEDAVAAWDGGSEEMECW